MICQKTIKPELYTPEGESVDGELQLTEQVIPIAMKNMAGIQKFRIPFKNLSEHDFEVEFNFHKMSSAVSQPALQRADSYSSNGEAVENPSPIEFTI